MNGPPVMTSRALWNQLQHYRADAQEGMVTDLMLEEEAELSA